MQSVQLKLGDMVRVGVVTLRAELGFGNGSRAQGFTLVGMLNEAVIYLIILSDHNISYIFVFKINSAQLSGYFYRCSVIYRQPIGKVIIYS